jgi:ATP-dependent Zn protease
LKEDGVIRKIMTIASVCFVLLCLVLLWGIVERGASLGKDTEIGYSDLFGRVQNGQVLDAAIQGAELHGHLKASPKDEFHTTLPANCEDLQRAMLAANVNFTIQETGIIIPLLFNCFPYFVLFMLTIPAFWAIFRKAGFPAVYSLLILVPFVNLAILYVVAYSQWKLAPVVKP